MAGDVLGYVDLPVSLRGSPGALALFRARRSMVVEPWAVFAFLAAALAVLTAIGWLRRVVGQF